MGALLVDRWLNLQRPSPDLAGMLGRIWEGDLGAARTPLPDACIDLVWVDDGSMWLVGPETRSWPRGYAPGTRAVGAGFRPGAGPSVLRVGAPELRDARVPLAAAWGDRVARELAERVAARPDGTGRARELEAALRRLAAAAQPADHVAHAVLAGLARPRPLPVRVLSRSLGLSERQLHRRCTAVFGYGPAVLARILRVERLLQLARSSPRPLRLAGLAAIAGYSDQQHLAHEVRAVFGTTPTELLRPIDTRREERGPGMVGA